MDFLHEIKGKNSFLFNTVQLFSKKTLRESIFKSCYGKATSQCRRRRARTRPHRPLAMSSKAVKKAKSVAPACVSKVSSGNIDSSMMVRNTIYKIDYVESSI